MDARQLHERLVALLNHHDAQGAAGLYAEDREFQSSGEATATGPSAVATLFQRLMDVSADLHVETKRAFGEGQVAAFEVVLSGTSSGPLPMPSGHVLPATGRAWGLPYMSIVEVDAGRISKHTVYLNNLSLLTQLGWAPSAPYGRHD